MQRVHAADRHHVRSAMRGAAWSADQIDGRQGVVTGRRGRLAVDVGYGRLCSCRERCEAKDASEPRSSSDVASSQGFPHLIEAAS